MTKLQKIVFFSLLGLVALLVYTEASKPEAINWFQSYSKKDKIPFGTYAFNDLLAEKFKENFIEKNRPPFEVLEDTTLTGTYLFINNYLSFDKTETNKLLDWTEKGNTLFVAANSIQGKLLDTLAIETDQIYSTNANGTEPLLELVNKNLKSKKPYHIKRNSTISFFYEIDTISQKALGITQSFDEALKITDPKINFIEAPFGKGKIYIHLQPEIFTNFFLLEANNSNYTEAVLSYIDPNKNIYWDNHYKSGKPIQLSPLYILLNNKYLKWAYYFTLIGAFLFVLFEGKRKQRNIPIVTPPSNKTYEYTRTIAGMYWDQKEFKAIASKQIALFMEFIRTRLRIPTEQVNSRFIKQVAARSNNTEEKTKELFALIEKVQKTTQVSQELLNTLEKEITIFKKKIDGKS